MRNRSASAMRGAAWLGSSQVIGQALGLFTALVLARRLGLAGFGEYALVSAVLYVANVATSFGTDMVLVRDVAASRHLRRAGAATVVQLGLSVAAVALLWSLAPLIGGPRHEVALALRIVSLSLLPSALYGVGTAVLRGLGMMRAYAVAGALSAAIPCPAVIVLVPNGAGVVRAAIALLASQTAVGLGVWMYCVRRARGLAALPRAPLGEVRGMLRASAPVGVLGLLGMAYQRLPVIVLGIAAGPAATGWFTCASRTVEASKTAHVGLFGAVYPRLAAAHASSARDEAARRDLRMSWRACIGLGVLVTVVLLAAGPFLVERLFGSGFAPSATGLRILALAVVPSTLATYGSLTLLAAHREAATLRVLGAGLLVLAAATAALVPALGWLGACWAVLGAETVTAALMLAATRRGAPRIAPARTAAPALPATVSRSWSR